MIFASDSIASAMASLWYSTKSISSMSPAGSRNGASTIPARSSGDGISAVDSDASAFPHAFCSAASSPYFWVRNLRNPSRFARLYPNSFLVKQALWNHSPPYPGPAGWYPITCPG